MRRVLACLLALALGAACAVLVACGGDGKGLIGSSDADAMQQQLDQIESSVRRGQCGGLSGELTDLQQQVNGLPKRVDASLRNRLQEGVNNLFEISPERCAAQAAKTETTTPVETTPTVPTDTTPTTPTETTPTTPTETTPTETTPPPTTVPTTPPATEPPPPTTTDGGSGGATVPGDTGGAGSGSGGTGGGTGGGVATP